MEARIIELSKAPQRQELIDYLNQQPLEELSNSTLLQLKNDSLNVDPIPFIRAIILGSPLDGGEDCINRRCMLLDNIITWMSNDVESITGSSAKIAANVANQIWPEIDTLPVHDLQKVGIRLLKIICQDKPMHPRLFEIISKVWNILSTSDSAAGEADLMLENICKSEWRADVAMGLASAFNEMELTQRQLERVIHRLQKQLAKFDPEEVPPFVYQLLLLSRKGHKRLILSSICDFFTDSNKNSDQAEASSRTQGTVMLHISFAIKQDQDLGIELIKYLKAEKIKMLETFNMACLLSAARLHRLEETIFELIKSTIITIYRDTDKSRKNAWISKYFSVDGDAVRNLLLDIAEKSASGWDQVIQSLTKLAMLLIDTVSNQGSWLKSNSTAVKVDRLSEQRPLDKISLLGIDVLLRMFKLHDVVRSEILEQITSRIVSRSSSAMDFLQLLENIIKKHPHAVEGYLNSIKDTLDYLSFLPNPTARRLLTAIQPVACENDQFRDGLMLVLRKSMFSKDQDGRMVSVYGFLKLLQGNAIEDSVSQKQNKAISTLGSEEIGFEILGLLRRCFSQQVDVRTEAYEGLGKLASQRVILAGDIFEILYAQFLKVYQQDTGVSTPLKLDVCVENSLTGGRPRIIEPIPILLVSLLKTLRALNITELNPVTAESAKKCCEQIISLTFRLSKADPEDFELDKSANFDTSIYTGLRNMYYSELLLGCYEAVMEYEFMTQERSQESCDIVLNIFKKRKALTQLIKENSGGDKGRKVSPCFSNKSVLSLESITSITQLMFSPDTVNSPINSLRSDINFVHHIVAATNGVLREAIEDEMDGNGEDNFMSCVILGKVYMHIIMTEGSDSSFIESQPKKGSSTLGMIIDTLHGVFEIVVKAWPDRLVEFIELLLNELEDPSVTKDQSVTNNLIISKMIEKFESVFVKYLSDRPLLYREATRIMQPILFFSVRLDRKASDFKKYAQKIVNWLDDFVKERPVEDVPLSKELVLMLIQISAEIDHFETIITIAKDVHKMHGDLDAEDMQDEEVEVSYMLINEKTCGAITLQLLSFLDQGFEDMVWCISRLKLCTDSAPEFESAVCKRMLSYLSITSELTKTVLVGIPAENLIKVLSKTYKALLALVKYKISNLDEITDDYVAVIAMAGTGVTEKMYRFLTIYGQYQDDTLAQNGRKKGKGKEPSNAREKAKIVRESKIIPNLIFVVEQFERHLIQLSRKSKKDLMQYMKRSTSRDFKIKADIVEEATTEDTQLKRPYEEAMDEGDEVEEGEEGEEDEEEEEEGSHTSKRHRLS
ncbi:FANCI solenoid 4-domain-containing protein [Phycomyces nitens]|nr:FANCI solenoid 4-domain-containing protein [Phycomyces nitens]